MKHKLLEIFLAVALCSVTRADAAHVYQSAVDVGVSTNASGTTNAATIQLIVLDLR
jgi:hypothetical protein